MTDRQGRRGPQVSSGTIIAGVALAGAGIMLTLAGFVVGTSHLLAASRRWIHEMEVPPSELARLKWAQARAAAAAGSNAWQQVPVNQRTRTGV